MSLFQPSGLLTTSNNRRPITTAPLSAVACSRISASTASCCMTQVWELRRIAEPVLVIGALPGHKPVERHGDVGDHVRHCSLSRQRSSMQTAGWRPGSSRTSKQVSRNEVIHGPAAVHLPRPVRGAAGEIAARACPILRLAPPERRPTRTPDPYSGETGPDDHPTD